MTPLPASYLWILLLLPLAGSGVNALLGAFVGNRLPRAAVAAIALLVTAASFALAIAEFFNYPGAAFEVHGPVWIAVSGFSADFGLYIDHLTLIMLLVVTGVGFLIHIYSTAYMAHEEGYWRFFSYLNLFMFFMLVLVLAGNYLLMFVGWEGVGLASYLLIGFYFQRSSAASAGKKAFVVNRIGDFGFLIAMFLLISHFGTLQYTAIFGQVASANLTAGTITAICLLMLLGAAGKSAQIPLYVWLPDAMEGPTPVSALIHAATMVTAGVYMIARSHALFNLSPTALFVVALIGTLTALFAASIGLVQTDIKRVLAYSTISQLGYMFLACGVAAYSAGIFHLVTHAFFKALLFLAAGSVIHALNGEQDMRVMGGLRRKIPVTFWTMTAGTLAIAGIFPFAGFFSKDEILFRAFSAGDAGKIFWAAALLTAFLTSFYMFRLLYLTFAGERRTLDSSAVARENIPTAHSDASKGHAVHESPSGMLGPLVILALLSLCGGWIGWPEALGGGNAFERYLAPVFSDAAANGSVATAPTASHSTELALAALSLCVALLGWLLADTFYRRRRDLPQKLSASAHGLYSLLVGKYWIDELYAKIIVAPLQAISRTVLFSAVDQGVIEGTADGGASAARGSGDLIRRIQSGNIRSYAGWLVAGAVVILLLSLLGHSFIAVPGNTAPAALPAAVSTSGGAQ